jgi:ribonuclease HI
MFDGTVLIWADGGCERNGSVSAKAFGSYVLRAMKDGELVKETRSHRQNYLQHHTNNAAELQVIINALSALTPGDYPVTVFSDSQLAVNVLTGAWSTNKPHLQALASEARDLIACFPQIEFVWTPRAEIVAVLGH